MNIQCAKSLEELRQFDGPELMAQQLVQHGAIHAIEFLLRAGVTLENANGMKQSLRANLSVIEETAREKGVLLPIVDHAESLGSEVGA